jgi:uncharacterized phage protein gp47/JayE
MLSRLADGSWAPLDALTTRSPDDLTLAFLDACATSADVLTFYQEYIANEGFLRTATELRSVVELARTIGYGPSPGLAARTWLAFSVEDPPQQMAVPGTPGAFASPTQALIPVGTKVQSVPLEAGELPQTFETVEEIAGRSEWNRMRLRTTRRQVLTVEGGVLKVIGSMTDPPVRARSLYLQGAATGLRPSDLLLVVVDDSAKTPLDPFSQRVETGAVAVFVDQVVSDPIAQTTRVDLVVPPDRVDRVPFRPPMLQGGRMEFEPLSLNLEDVSELHGHALDEQSLATLLKLQRWSPARLVGEIAQLVACTAPPAKVFLLRQRVAFFGHNGKLRSLSERDLDHLLATAASLIDSSRSLLATQTTPSGAEAMAAFRVPTIWQNEAGQVYGQSGRYLGLQVFVERSVPEIRVDSWVVFQKGAMLVPLRVAASADMTLSYFDVTGRATGLALDEPLGTVRVKPSDYAFLDLRSTTAHVQSEPLTVGELPIDPIVAAGESSVMLEGMVLGLTVGQRVSWTGEGVGDDGTANGLVSSEIVELGGIVHSRGHTTLTFASPLGQSYARATVTLNANLARATHGESVVGEILGSGDATQLRQSWRLARKPLTHVLPTNGTGPGSTLTVCVDGVAWREVPSLYGQSADARVYALQQDEEGATTVLFGSRLPTGTANVMARYRTGSGSAGEVAAGTLGVLQSRPLGVRGVTNPLAATGSQGAESPDDLRDHAAQSTRTLGRVVSLSDYEDFAASFPGIGKTQAVSMWSGGVHVVHLTVAAATGGSVDDEGRQLLLDALHVKGDPTQAILIENYAPRYFRVGVALVVEPDHALNTVKQAVATAMLDAFAFAKRGFGQPVTEAEIMTLVQAVPGVVASMLSGFLDPARATNDPDDVLRALPARWDSHNQRPAPAELLLLDPNGLTVSGAYAP